MKLTLKFAARLCLLAITATVACAQYEGELTAKRRLYSEAGGGVRAVKRAADRTYILGSQGVVVFDAKEHKLLTVGSAAPSAAPQAGLETVSFAEDFDVDASGQIYVADRAANLIAVYSAEGTRVRSFPVPAPLSIAALPDGELGVATLHDPHLITVFDKNGREIREFGELDDISSRADLNRYLNSGYLATDASGNLYYAFIFSPEPTIRVYDRNGFSAQIIQFTGLDAFAGAQAARKEIERQEKRGKQPAFKPLLTAIDVVRTTGEVWIALHSRLLRFDKEGNRKATYQLYTPEGTRLEANTILIEKDRVLIGSNTLGIFEFERPDIKLEQ
jgi:hypothetical protein